MARGASGAVIEGLEGLLHVLGAMQQKASKRVLRSALRYGLSAIGTAMRREARKRIGGGSRKNIPPAIGTAVGKDREGRIEAKAGVFVGSAAKKRTGSNWFAFLLALGTALRFRRRRADAATGSVDADDFVGRGYALAAHAAQGRISKRARELIEKEILRARG